VAILVENAIFATLVFDAFIENITIIIL